MFDVMRLDGHGGACHHPGPTAALRCAMLAARDTGEAALIEDENGDVVACITRRMALVTNLPHWSLGRYRHETRAPIEVYTP